MIPDELRLIRFPVLDDGFVCLIDASGSDARICHAARLTSGSVGKDDRQLLRYLYRLNHGTPFEFASVILHLRAPMDVMRQWTRHRTWKYLSINEYSTRYSEAIDSAQKTEPTAWRSQAAGNRQGSGDFLPEHPVGVELSAKESYFHQNARELYEWRLEAGVAREQARKDLPLSTYTELWVEIDLRNLLEFLALRMDQHAQSEIRAYANVIGNEIVGKLFPLCWESFRDYRLEAMTLSRVEVAVFRAMIGQARMGNFDAKCEPEEWQGKKQCRERDEFAAKLKRLGWPDGVPCAS